MHKHKLTLLAVLPFIFASSAFSQRADKEYKNSSITQLEILKEKSGIDFSFPLPELSSREKDKSVCQYPNDNIYSGKDLAPSISDNRRVEAILNLIKKISECEKLPFKEDGQVFKNKENKLPAMPQGYYREYTLIVPKNSPQQFYIGETVYTAAPSYGTRGAERLVIGGGATVYYTPTHYASFVEVAVIKAGYGEQTEKAKENTENKTIEK